MKRGQALLIRNILESVCELVFFFGADMLY